MTWEFDFLLWIQEWHNPILDKLMILLSTLGDAGILWIALAVLLIIPKKYRKIGIQMLVSIAVTFIIGNLILKHIFMRTRPCQIMTDVPLLLHIPSDSSFPSGHSMNGFTSAVTLLLCKREFGIPALVIASGIAFSRLYTFMHFPTDVLAGIAIGTLLAVAVDILFRRKGWHA